MKLHYKLFLAFGSIMAATLLFVFIYIDVSFNRYHLSQLKNNIKKQSISIRHVLSNFSTEKGSLEDFAHQIGEDLSLRITILDHNGTVIGDTDLSHKDMLRLDNHIERPEIQDAIKNGEGWSKRFSTTLKKDILYYATPIIVNNKKAFLRLSIPIEKISLISEDIEGALFVSLSLVFIATLVLGLLVFHIISRPIRELASKALEMASGDLTLKFSDNKNDEVGELGKALNSMRDNIKSKMEEVVTNNSRFEAVLMSMFEGVMAIDLNGNIILMNTALKEMLHIKDTNIMGRKPIELVRNINIQNIAEKVIKRSDGVLSLEENLLMPYNKTLLIHASPVVKDNDVFGAVLVFSDITELRKLETIRRDFVANVSHELRTPISSIKGYAETLLDGALSDKDNAHNFINIINMEASRLASLINDILDLSKIESEMFKLNLEEKDIKDLISTSIDRVKQAIDIKGIKIENNVGSLKVKYDEALLGQAVINLIHNAIKYSDSNSVINVYSEAKGDRVVISVQDSGIGIPEKDLPRIFERFYRVDKARSKDLGGTGLGLSIVKHIVQAHGGEVSVESVEGVGSTFSFYIPLKK